MLVDVEGETIGAVCGEIEMGFKEVSEETVFDGIDVCVPELSVNVFDKVQDCDEPNDKFGMPDL